MILICVSGALNQVTVKQERPDEAEIRELAAKMVEAHKAKMGTAAAQAAAAAALQPRPQVGNQTNLSGLLGYYNRRPTPEATTPKPAAQEGKPPSDDESLRGRFGWTTFGDTHIPYIFRAAERYCAVRILESKLLNKYLNSLSGDIYSCTCIRSYYISDAESKLLNEINTKHCENQFGREQFTCKDLVVRMGDAKEFYTFLDVCYSKLNAGSAQNAIVGHNKPDKCGFIRINKESVVPYTIKGGLKYVPLFYFEGETENLKLKAEQLEGWDLSYLKFCCKVQGIRNELFASDSCSVISLNDIKSYFPPGTGFEDYWPRQVTDNNLLVNSKGSGSGGGWTKQPPTPPQTKQPVQNNVTKNSINARGASLQNMLPRNSIPGTTLQRVSQRPGVTTHPVPSSPSAVSSVRTNQVSQPMMNAVQAASVNGWSGLVGGQPTFPTPLSQANSIIRMTTGGLNMHNVNNVSIEKLNFINFNFI